MNDTRFQHEKMSQADQDRYAEAMQEHIDANPRQRPTVPKTGAKRCSHCQYNKNVECFHIG